MKTLAPLVLSIMICISMNSQLMQDLDEVGNYNEGLASINKGDQWAFMDKEGNIVIEFRNDLASYIDENGEVTPPMFHDGRAIKTITSDDIKLFGYIDVSGKEVIKCEYVNATPYSKGFAIVMRYSKKVVGQNKLLDKNVVNYQIEESVIDVNGKAMTPSLNARNYGQEKMKSGKSPKLSIKFIGERMIAVKMQDQKWDIYSF
jgi:hypothetical protein